MRMEAGVYVPELLRIIALAAWRLSPPLMRASARRSSPVLICLLSCKLSFPRQTCPSGINSS